jgi:hypothetical protein
MDLRVKHGHTDRQTAEGLLLWQFLFSSEGGEKKKY